MPDIGYGALLLTLVTAASSALAAALGARQRRPQWVARAATGLLAASGFVALATAILVYLLLTRDFRVRYVYMYTSTTQPALFLVTALWAGQEGSFLLWLLWLAVVSMAVLRQRPRWPTTLWAYTISTLAVVQAFFALVLLTVQNPFATYAMSPWEGRGLAPALFHPAMVAHPPILFLGNALWVVPFAFTMAQLAMGREDREAEREREATSLSLVRQWGLMAWLLLGLGIAIGAWWAYTISGWGGYWSWDNVENASLLPWLVGTAYLHALMTQARQSTFRRWSSALAVGTFLLCIFGTLVTRGGIIRSDLHALSDSIQPVAYYLLAFIVAAALVYLRLFRLRWNDLADANEAERLLSRESAVLLSNLLFVGLAAAILVGMLFPTIAQVLRGTQVYLQTAFYNRVFAPLALFIVLLMAVCPLLGWKESSGQKLVNALRYPIILSVILSAALFGMGIRQPAALLACALVAFAAASILGEFLRAVRVRSRLQSSGWLRCAGELLLLGRRRYGARAVHLAMLLITVGICGSSLYKSEERVYLAPQSVAPAGGYTLKLEDLEVDDEASRLRFVAVIGIYKGQSRMGVLRPQKSLYTDGQEVTDIAIRSTLKEDLYVALESLDEQGVATIQVSVYPLVIWLWIGGGLLLLGTLAALWPDGRERHEQLTP